jgi:hypothetical protein
MDAIKAKSGISRSLGWPFYVLTALSLSIGWGIRGNYGHEFGAMLPGALAAMAVVLTSSREDWQRRIAYFATFGAIGWSFGGSQSYMMVVAYTHSGHSPSVWYGFFGLFVIGFLWAAPGGMGTALPAYASRERLTEIFAPMSAVFGVWIVQWLWGYPWLTWTLAAAYGAREANRLLNWYDSDWISALTALLAVLAFAAIRRRYDRATYMIVHMCVGWWVAFLLLPVGGTWLLDDVLGLDIGGLRMTPPRGDNWAGCLGMTVGLLIFFARTGLAPVARVGLVTGFLGGIGFAGATMLKLLEITTGLPTNWHSVMEQTGGLLHGVALAVAMGWAVRTPPEASDEPPIRRWTEVYAVGFVLLAITYVNLVQNVEDWTRAMAPEVRGVPLRMGGLSALAWFNLGYLAVAVALLVPLVRHLKRPLPILQTSALGRGQWLYLILLWWMIVGNLGKQLTHFTGQRLITEGVVLVNAAICTLILLLSDFPRWAEAREDQPGEGRIGWGKLISAGLAAALVATTIDWGIVRAVWGDEKAPYANKHIRFGPNRTIKRPNSPA